MCKNELLLCVLFIKKKKGMVLLARIWIDPGHGGTDSGAKGKGLIEKALNLIVSLEVERLLKLNGQVVELTRRDDTFVDLNERCKRANKWKADLFISIHHNACDGKAKGAEVINSIYHGKGEILAKIIAAKFQAVGQVVRRVFSKEGSSGGDYYCVIRETRMTAVITEFAFIDNSEDAKKVDTKAELMAEARAIADGILTFIGVKMKG